MTLRVRPAQPGDDAALLAVDAETWGPHSSPVAPPAPGERPTFFTTERPPEGFLVAVLEGVVVGFVALHAVPPTPSHDHVLRIDGLGVLPSAQGRGAGRALVEAAVDRARSAGAAKVTLAVLGSNGSARRLYERCGFEVEGVLRGEYRLSGVEVDDVLMARFLDR